MEGLQAEIIAAKNKINRYERVFKRIAPREYAEEESKPESAVLDVASLYHELASETEYLRGRAGDEEAYEEFSEALRKMRGDVSGGGKRNKKSKKRKSKRRRSKRRRSR